jgi:predicted short-subunit dehydrogenase-like oxidoreductase (DUF2520 family)
MRTERITIIGTGNVAKMLGKALYDSGHEIKEVAGRSPEKVMALANELGAKAATEGISRINEFSTLYLIAVTDDAIEQVVHAMPDVQGLVVHTSGSVSSRVIMGKYPKWGVFYPLQTFTPGRNLDFNKIPFVISASTQSIEAQLKELAASVGSKAHLIGDEDRRHLHLAAVMVNNFGNHLLTLAGDYLKARHLDDKLLDALALETVNKAIATGAPHSQTGPAKRGDTGTIEQHVAMLRDQSQDQLADLYEKFSDCIQKYYHKG